MVLLLVMEAGGAVGGAAGSELFEVMGAAVWHDALIVLGASSSGTSSDDDHVSLEF
jgi:hypothetical protein